MLRKRRNDDEELAHLEEQISRIKKRQRRDLSPSSQFREYIYSKIPKDHLELLQDSYKDLREFNARVKAFEKQAELGYLTDPLFDSRYTHPLVEFADEFEFLSYIFEYRTVKTNTDAVPKLLERIFPYLTKDQIMWMWSYAWFKRDELRYIPGSALVRKTLRKHGNVSTGNAFKFR